MAEFEDIFRQFNDFFSLDELNAEVQSAMRELEEAKRRVEFAKIKLANALERMKQKVAGKTANPNLDDILTIHPMKYLKNFRY